MSKPVDTGQNDEADEHRIIPPVTDAFIESMRGILEGKMPPELDRDPDRELFP